MLETAERFTDHEGEPAVQQYLLLVGGLRTRPRACMRPRLVLDAFLLRSLAVNGGRAQLRGVREMRYAGAQPVLFGRFRRSGVRGVPGARQRRTLSGVTGSSSARCSPAV